jgi:hypothetical protein
VGESKLAGHEPIFAFVRSQQLPTAEQAEVIRDVLGIHKRVEFGPAELERRRALIKGLALVPGPANATGPVPLALREEAAILDADPTH